MPPAVGELDDPAGDGRPVPRHGDLENVEPSAQAIHVLVEEHRHAGDELERLVEAYAVGDGAVERRHVGLALGHELVRSG